MTEAKARVMAAALPGGVPDVAWYHESRVAAATADVIVAVANDYDVRTRIASRSAPITLHATTGANWISQLHRHVADRDDCIRCRVADLKTPAFRCSDGVLPPTVTEPEGGSLNAVPDPSEPGVHPPNHVLGLVAELSRNRIQADGLTAVKSLETGCAFSNARTASSPSR